MKQAGNEGLQGIIGRKSDQEKTLTIQRWFGPVQAQNKC